MFWYPATRGFSLAWLLAFTKSFASLVIHIVLFFCPGRKSCGELLVDSVEPAQDCSFIIIEIMTQISSHERNHNAVESRKKVPCGVCFAQRISLFDWLKPVIKPVNHVSTSKILEVSKEHAQRKLHAHTALCRSFSHGINKPTTQMTSDASKVVMLKAMQERNLCLQGSIVAPYVNPPS